MKQLYLSLINDFSGQNELSWEPRMMTLICAQASLECWKHQMRVSAVASKLTFFLVVQHGECSCSPAAGSASLT